MTTIFVKEGTELPEKRPYDEYETPPPFVAAATRYFAEYIHDHRVAIKQILDPSAGRSGIWGVEAYNEYGGKLVGVDVQEIEKPSGVYDEWYPSQDFMKWSAHQHQFNLITTNPPYRKVERFIEKCWSHLAHNGYMMFLLRLNFLASKRRQILFEKCYLSDVMVSVSRISFYGTGTNATEYGVFVFQKTDKQRATKLHWLDWK